MFTNGDIVKIKSEFLNSKEEENTSYVVREFNGDRVIIAPVVWNGYIVPTELVGSEMIEKF
jgi:hypothetical protein